MTLRLPQAKEQRGSAGFSLIEILISFLIFSMIVSGMIYGYVQANRMAEWSAMSLAAQSYASQGAEQARSAQWNSQQYPVTNGPGTSDQIILFDSAGLRTGSAATSNTNFFTVNLMDVPITGAGIPVTNFICVTNLSLNPPLRQIRSDCVWTFPITGQLCTNTVVLLRAPDQ